MNLARLEIAGKPVLALIRHDRYLPLGAVDDRLPNDLCAFLAETDWDALEAEATATKGWVPLDGAKWLPPLSETSRILCVGKNYADHVKEMDLGGKGGPVAPDIFVRFPSSFVGHGGTIEFPEGEDSFDYEGELVLVVGKGGRRIKAGNALSHIFGYTTANDGSLRRIQKRTSQFTLGKNVDRSGALGPAIVPSGKVPDPQRLGITTEVAGETMQSGNTADMTFDIGTVIETISSVMELQPGDIILTGTPAGVGAGRKPPRFLKSGETVRISIEKLPSLEMTVAQT